MKVNFKQPMFMSAARQRGFTLIELMISLTIGLLVSAVAIQLFTNSQRTIALQQGASNLQNASLFGLESMLRDVRLANLNASEPFIDNLTPQGGIVFSGFNLSTKTNPDGTSAFSINNNLLTRGKIGPSNLASQNSDQLVIQYRNTAGNQFDCEGNGLNNGAYVVERFFLRADTNSNDPNQPLALACKAASYQNVDEVSLPALSGDGQILISRVDHLSVMLGVARDGGMNASCTAVLATALADGVLDCFGYISINDYLALAVKPQIVSIKLGLLIRSPDSIGGNNFFDKNKQYDVLGTKAKLIEDTKNSLYMRNVVTQTIAVRNGFGIQN